MNLTNESSELDRLSSRIRTLEVRQRRVNRFLVLVGIGAAAAASVCWFQNPLALPKADAAASTMPTDSISAQSFRVLSASGKVLMELGSKQDQAYMTLKDRSGTVRAALSLGRVGSDDEAVTFWLKSGAGDDILALRGPSSLRDPEIVVARDKATINLSVIGGGEATPVIRMLNPNGKEVWKVP